MRSRAYLAIIASLLMAALCAIPSLPPVSAGACVSLAVDANGTTTITSTTNLNGVYAGDTVTETDGGGHIPAGDIVLSVSGSSAVLSEAVSAASNIATQFCSLGSISPASGPAGTVITISGSGFTDSHTYYYCYEPATTTPSACSATDQLTTDGSGNIPAGVTVASSGATSGFVVVYDPTGAFIAFSEPFTISTSVPEFPVPLAVPLVFAAAVGIYLVIRRSAGPTNPRSLGQVESLPWITLEP